MFHHVAMFKFKAGTTSAQVEEITSRLEELPGRIDVLAGYRFAPDAGVTEGSWDYVVIADLPDADAYVTYKNHPAHAALVDEFIGPIVAQAARVQFES